MSESTISIFFDGWHGMMKPGLPATMDQLVLAQSRSVKKLARWIQVQIAREASRETKVPQSALKSRFRRSLRGDTELSAHIWIGVNPLPARKIGRVGETAQGAKAGRRFFRKAFVANVYSDYEQIWLRKSAKRLPIQEVAVPLSEGFEKVLDKYEEIAARKFEEIFEHELKYAMGWFK